MLWSPGVWRDSISSDIGFLLFAPDLTASSYLRNKEVQSFRVHTGPSQVGYPVLSHAEDIQNVLRVRSSKIARERLLLAEGSLLPACVPAGPLESPWGRLERGKKSSLQMNTPRSVAHKMGSLRGSNLTFPWHIQLS